jgi:OOP family OmpA-OmpF porin
MKNILKCLPLLLVIILLSSCQTHFSSTARKAVLAEDVDVINLDERLNDGRHVQKVDNLIFMVDDSNALLKRDDGVLQRDLLFALLTRMQRTIPNIKLDQGLRIFGPHANEYDFKNTLIYGMPQEHESRIKPFIINNTPEDTMFNQVAMATDALYQEMRNVSGNTAVIILSSFQGPDSKSLIDSVTAINELYGKRISIYPLFFASKKQPNTDIAYLSKVAVNGYIGKAQELREPDKLADFMEGILFDINSPPPVLTQVPKEAPRMAQNDATPSHTIVVVPLSHEKLVKEKELRVQLKTQFDFNQAVIRPEYKGKLQAVAKFMIKYPETTTTIEGHTCSMGPAEYNLKLSARRAQAVKDYLVHAGVDAFRLSTAAYGETKPVADNSTEAGREKNRRVMAIIKTIVTK